MDKVIEAKHIAFYKTSESQLDYVVALEQEEHNREFIFPYSKQKHRNILQDPDILHLLVKEKLNHEIIGFIILAGLESQHLSLEFRRIVINTQGRGFGRASLQLVKRFCFKELGFHRLWLDVFEHNERAIYLYKSEGFREEGMLRESVKTHHGFRSLKVLSILENEYHF